MAPGRRAAVAAAQRRGGDILDVGVGTGLELPMFNSKVNLVGVDLSEPMLRRAQSRVARKNCASGGALRDGRHAAGFSFGAFRLVVAPYVLTVVPDPAATLDELARVVKPGGEIVLVNHVGADSGPIALVERWLGQKAAKLG